MKRAFAKASRTLTRKRGPDTPFGSAWAGVVRGRVLVAGPLSALSDPRGVTKLDVVTIDPRSDTATILADLDDPGALADVLFDCVVFAPSGRAVTRAALDNVWGAVAPGGALVADLTDASRPLLDALVAADGGIVVARERSWVLAQREGRA